MRKNPRGLVIELVLPARLAGDKPRAFRQIVIFDGTVLERCTTDAARSKHWRGTTYGEGNTSALAVMDSEAWFGKYIEAHAVEGYVLHGKPFLIEANEKELAEISDKAMPRAMVLRIDKSRTEVGAATNPWTGE